MKELKKWSPTLGSLIMLLPGHIIALLFVALFAELTGLLMVGYIIACLSVGAWVGLPSMHAVRKNVQKRSVRICLYVGLALGFAILLFLSMLSFNVRR